MLPTPAGQLYPGSRFRDYVLPKDQVLSKYGRGVPIIQQENEDRNAQDSHLKGCGIIWTIGYISV
jgi:hypothetical protein